VPHRSPVRIRGAWREHRRFLQRVAESPSDIVLVSGVIAMAASLDAYLQRLIQTSFFDLPSNLVL
jgi:hypothetical protein